jgi:amidase
MSEAPVTTGAEFLVRPDRTRASVRLRGFLRRPTPAQLHDVAARENITLDEADVELYTREFDVILGALDRLDTLIPDAPALRWTERGGVSTPTGADDPLNAVVAWCDVKGAPEGPLQGVRIGIKDNIAVAGVPVTNGSRHLPFTPTMDALVTERLLDAGGRVVAKTTLDDYSALGTGESSFTGPALNPHDPGHSSGGSSGGTGSAVASGLIDLGLAVDQGGSARIPASFNGVVSILATHGRIPSFGVTYMDNTIDYICPVARTVREVAVAFDVLAGDDPRDPQWARYTPQPGSAVAGLDDGIAGRRLVIVEEGMAGTSPDVLEAFEASCAAFEAGGATIERISIPLWAHGWDIELSLLTHLGWAMAQSEGIGYGHKGYVDAARSHGFALSRRLEADGYAPFYKMWMLAGRYLHDEYFNTMLAKGMNLRWTLTEEVKKVLGHYDAIITPTTPHVATRLLEQASGEKAIIDRGTTMVTNTCITNLTGNPSLAMPNGRGEGGLPTSIQIIAAHGADELALTIGHTLEQAVGTFPVLR